LPAARAELAWELLVTEFAQEWRWVGEDGVEKTVAEEELIAELSSESLPNFTLVWRKGWLEWLPAMQIEELSWALPPGKSDEPVTPREQLGANSPPAPPLYRYPVLKRRAANLKSDKPPTPIPRSNALLPSLPPDDDDSESESDPYAVHPTRADLAPVEDVEFASIEASNPRAASNPDTAPPSAPFDPDEPPPSLAAASRFAFAGRTYDAEDEAETRVLPSKPPPAVAYVGPHSPPPQYTPIEDGEEVPEIPRPPRSPVDLGAYSGAAARRPRKPPASKSQRRYLIGAGASFALLVLVWLVRREEPEPRSVVTEASASAAVAVAPPTVAPVAPVASAQAPEPVAKAACTPVTSALRVAEWADPGVVPAFSDIPGSNRLAVGFAQSDSYAVGITIDPRSFDRDQVFREFRKEKLASVVPTIDGGKLHFQVCREGTVLSNARAVDAEPPFFLGTHELGIARARGKGDPERVWPIADAVEVTVPRVATIPGVGHAVAFRRGAKKSSHVAVGWLTPDGKNLSALGDIRATGDMTGTPAVAAGDDGVLIVFATFDSRKDAAGWSLEYARAKAGALPGPAAAFVLPAGGPRGDAIAPSAASLSGGRWLLQWTEGSAGNRVVRAQVLSHDLTPIGRAMDLSPPGSNAGQGVIWAHNDLGTVLFYVRGPKGTHELWGASIACPP
jgi:hypothetical protein